MAFFKWVILILTFMVVVTGKKSSYKAGFTKLNQKRDAICGAEDFKCSDGTCVQNEWVCDTDEDCDDGSDEVGCPSDCSGDHQVKCKNDKCIPVEYQCDGENDCGDNTDESDCDKSDKCPNGEFQCDNFLCIEQSWRCDAVDDCGTGFDEANCTNNCSASQFRCADGSQCIDIRWQCNGKSDCPDGSDERSCYCLPSVDYICANKHCVPLKWYCDGEDDCGDNSDEEQCASVKPSLCSDMMTLSDCSVMNTTVNPICLRPVEGHKYCRKFCAFCA